jgi:glycosyltransferase involved in cell wall biosynthesis
LTAPPARPQLPVHFESWSAAHHPVISTALFFRREYGFGLLVQAIAELRRKHPRLGCIVMGDTESRPEGEKLIREHGLQQQMLAIGDVTHESCLAIIARSDIFVRTTYSDGDAISVREAIALGTPVVASDVVRRPAGTLCFKTGDAGDLGLKIDSLLSGPIPDLHKRQIRGGPDAAKTDDAGPETGRNGIHRLLELYGS